MASQDVHVPAPGTTSDDYSHCYYNAAHLGGYSDYRWENDEWRQFFLMVAERIIAVTNATTVLDVGCAKGLLVQALNVRGADAWGFDVSEHAIETAHDDVRDRLEVRSATEPIPGHYSVISCIEVLEHLSPADAQLAIDHMCAASDRIVFSSSPIDHAEPTHINTQPAATWALWFAERGFYRRVDVNLDFLARWAVLYEKADVDLRTVVHRYESLLAPMSVELHEKRDALLAAHRTISGLHDESGQGADGNVADLHKRLADMDREVMDVRHEQLTMRDHIIGYEAEAARLTNDLAVARRTIKKLRDQVEQLRRKFQQERVAARRKQKRLDEARQALRAERRRAQDRAREVEALKRSRTWRAGRLLVAPFSVFRR